MAWINTKMNPAGVMLGKLVVTSTIQSPGAPLVDKALMTLHEPSGAKRIAARCISLPWHLRPSERWRTARMHKALVIGWGA